MKTEQRVINRVIKFRAWDKLTNRMSPAFQLFGEFLLFGAVHDWQREAGKGPTLERLNDLEIMQFTGKHCFNNREVYEGDILFYEQQEDGGDVRYYLVVAWIEEWSMFATLHRSEYNTYLISGAEALDEGLFWTYTLEGCKDYHYAGNIHENPELLNIANQVSKDTKQILESKPLSSGEKEEQKSEEIEAEANALLIAKLLDVLDRAYSHMRYNPPDKTKMSYNEWRDILEHLQYYRSEFGVGEPPSVGENIPSFKEAAERYANLIHHVDPLHHEACALDFEAGAKYGYATTRPVQEKPDFEKMIEDLVANDMLKLANNIWKNYVEKQANK